MRKRALVTILVAIALFLIAGTIRSGWLYLVSSLLFALAAFSLFSSWRSSRGIVVARECPREAFEKESFRALLRVENSSRFPKYFVEVRDLQFYESGGSGFLQRLRERHASVRQLVKAGAQGEDPGPPGHAPTITFELLAPREAKEVNYEVYALKRGVYEECKLAVGSGGMFGTVQAERQVMVDSPMTIFPGIYKIKRFPPASRNADMPEESFEWTRKGIGQDYYGVREYVRGDSLRNVHWKSSARHGNLIVKEYQEEMNPSTAILLLLGEPAFGKSDENSLEDGLRVAASIASYQAEAARPPEIVIPQEGTFEVVETSNLYECLKVLAAYEPDDSLADERDIVEGFLLSRNSMMPGSAISIVTNLPPESIARAIELTPALEGSVLVAVLDGSYARKFDERDGSFWREELAGAASARSLNLYCLTEGYGIGRCLNEPLNTIA